MNPHTNHIQNIAEKALATIGCTEAPVPIKEVASKFNLEVIEFEFPDSFSGVLKKERRVIGVNKKHHNVRKRFTIAHELGHFLLGHNIADEQDILDDDFDKPIHKEKEANIFASQILMPANWVKNDVAKNGKIDLKQLASKYEVSEQAITIRLLELNLI